MSPAIQMRDVHKSFGHVKAVRGMELNVPTGTVYGILGPNGAGKTTTMHLLLGLIAPDRGDIHVLGNDMRTNSDVVRAATGVLLEHDGLYERLTPRENLEFHARCHDVPREQREARVDAALRAADLLLRADDTTGTLSRGMKRRLAVARAFLSHPKLVILDEPTSGFDPAASHALHDTIRNLVRTQDLTVVLATHDLHEAEAVCDRIAVLRSGQVVAEGTPDDLRASTERILLVGEGFTPEVIATLQRRRDVLEVDTQPRGIRVRMKPGSRPRTVVAAAIRAGAGIDEVRPLDGGLSEAFRELVQ